MAIDLQNWNSWGKTEKIQEVSSAQIRPQTLCVLIFAHTVFLCLGSILPPAHEHTHVRALAGAPSPPHSYSRILSSKG